MIEVGFVDVGGTLASGRAWGSAEVGEIPSCPEPLAASSAADVVCGSLREAAAAIQVSVRRSAR